MVGAWLMVPSKLSIPKYDRHTYTYQCKMRQLFLKALNNKNTSGEILGDDLIATMHCYIPRVVAVIAGSPDLLLPIGPFPFSLSFLS